MKYAKLPLLFCTGGTSYMILELIWRGRSHGSMFLAGGICFLLLGRLAKCRIAFPLKALTGTGIITAVELGVGLLFNRSYQVWDYRQMPFSLYGQICLPFSLLWIPVGLGAMGIYRLLDAQLKTVSIMKTG